MTEKFDTPPKLLEHYRDVSPHVLFDAWFTAAAEFEGQDVNAMSLATVAAGVPQVRTVLLKEHNGQAFVFYTNNESRKGTALQAHPQAALLFFWRGQRRQVLIEGEVEQLSQQASAPYYQSRPRGSRIAAWASAQSRPIESYALLQQQVAEQEERFKTTEPPIPPYWRGFSLTPLRIEFWQEGDFRLHQRLAFSRPTVSQAWQSELLQP